MVTGGSNNDGCSGEFYGEIDMIGIEHNYLMG